MKKVITAIFAVLYLSTSLGASIHFHYCMGKLISWSLINRESDHCAFCGMSKSAPVSKAAMGKSNCCKDDHKQIKTSGDQKSAQDEIQVLKNIPAVAALLLHRYTSVPLAERFFSGRLIHAPPLSDEQPVYLLNCNFRI